ncbi:MAG: maleylpyruvate isomerase family mycothiol-dependent enzyme [Ilumatobacteraceae bacterium]
MNTRPAVANLESCWTSIDDVFDPLTDDQWSTQSLCPDWSVRGVMVHLGAVEYMLLGEPPGSMPDALPFDKVGDWMTQVAALSDLETLGRYRQVISARREELAAMSDDDFDQPCMTPVGPGTYGRFMDVRVFDFWVHEQDVRMPLGMAGHETGPAAEMAIAEIEASLGYIVGRKIGLPDGKGMTIDLTGPIERTFHVAVDGRAVRVDSLADPDVTLQTDSTTFALLACGRLDPQAPIGDGRVKWHGDTEWGERAARNLAFTM